ncbi:wd-40 repeat protein [Stylonychia lemnae]|uniref:Wd-40 repeat protein n=1 Tax=Stylonychia lemnae TaxID=5949 RepID=A0A078A3Y9_STYLE|nr:wd-40 repeat protein [Stylonychia lemnae]|eukprot:CDW76983.1 wd-40 repeat protein [Stylonychia lemnae]
MRSYEIDFEKKINEVRNQQTQMVIPPKIQYLQTQFHPIYDDILVSLTETDWNLNDHCYSEVLIADQGKMVPKEKFYLGEVVMPDIPLRKDLGTQKKQGYIADYFLKGQDVENFQPCKLYDFSISMWRIMTQHQPTCLKEYRFNGMPYQRQFYFSHDGKVIFFLLIYNANDVKTVKWLVSLDSTTLRETSDLLPISQFYGIYFREEEDGFYHLLFLHDKAIQMRKLKIGGNIQEFMIEFKDRADTTAKFRTSSIDACINKDFTILATKDDAITLYKGSKQPDGNYKWEKYDSMNESVFIMPFNTFLKQQIYCQIYSGLIAFQNIKEKFEFKCITGKSVHHKNVKNMDQMVQEDGSVLVCGNFEDDNQTDFIGIEKLIDGKFYNCGTFSTGGGYKPAYPLVYYQRNKEMLIFNMCNPQIIHKFDLKEGYLTRTDDGFQTKSLIADIFKNNSYKFQIKGFKSINQNQADKTLLIQRVINLKEKMIIETERKIFFISDQVKVIEEPNFVNIPAVYVENVKNYTNEFAAYITKDDGKYQIFVVNKQEKLMFEMKLSQDPIFFGFHNNKFYLMEDGQNVHQLGFNHQNTLELITTLAIQGKPPNHLITKDKYRYGQISEKFFYIYGQANVLLDKNSSVYSSKTFSQISLTGNFLEFHSNMHAQKQEQANRLFYFGGKSSQGINIVQEFSQKVLKENEDFQQKQLKAKYQEDIVLNGGWLIEQRNIYMQASQMDPKTFAFYSINLPDSNYERFICYDDLSRDKRESSLAKFASFYVDSDDTILFQNNDSYIFIRPNRSYYIAKFIQQDGKVLDETQVKAFEFIYQISEDQKMFLFKQSKMSFSLYKLIQSTDGKYFFEFIREIDFGVSDLKLYGDYLYHNGQCYLSNSGEFLYGNSSVENYFQIMLTVHGKDQEILNGHIQKFSNIYRQLQELMMTFREKIYIELMKYVIEFLDNDIDHLKENQMIDEIKKTAVQEQTYSRVVDEEFKTIHKLFNQEILLTPDSDKIKVYMEFLAKNLCKQWQDGVFQFLEFSMLNMPFKEFYKFAEKKYRNFKSSLYTDKGIAKIFIVGSYIILEYNGQIEYYNYQQKNMKFSQMRIQLTSEHKLITILNTALENVYLFYIASSRRNYQITILLHWDLTKNKEYSSHEFKTELWNTPNPQSMIRKSFSQKLNYFYFQGSIYDLQFQFPLRFHSNIQTPKRYLRHYKSQFRIFNEISMDKSMYLSWATCYNQYSLYDLIYFQKLNEVQMIDWDVYKIEPSALYARINTNTIFHQYILDFKALDVIIKVIEQSQDQIPQIIEILNHIFYPNKYGKSAFDIAIDNFRIRNIELILQTMNQYPQFKLTHAIRKHFNILLNMGIVQFNTFLEGCTFKNYMLEDVRQLQWQSNDEEQYLGYHTSFITDSFLEAYDFIQKLDAKEKIKIDHDFYNKMSKVILDQAHLDPTGKEELKTFISKDAVKNLSTSQENFKGVNFSIVDFDEIFLQGEFSKQFIKSLIDSNQDNFFGIYTIKVLLLFLWEKFFYKIRNRIFFPYVLYMSIFLLYATDIYDRHMNDDSQTMTIIYWIIIAALFSFLAFFFFIEILQVFNYKGSYFLSYWNILDLISISLNIAFILLDLSNVESTKVRPLVSVAVFLMWIKLFYFMRLFQPTASFIRMIVQIFLDMSTFLLFLVIALVGFGNTFYILAVNLVESNKTEEETPELFTGNFGLAMIYAYRAGLGDFATDQYASSKEEWLLWIFFLLITILIQIVMLNLLIAIMGDTFDKVIELGEQSMLKEVAQMIYENEFLINRSKEFADIKYIVVAKIDQAGEQGVFNWGGKLENLKVSFQKMIDDQNKVISKKLEQAQSNNTEGRTDVQSQLRQLQHQMADIKLLLSEKVVPKLAKLPV